MNLKIFSLVSSLFFSWFTPLISSKNQFLNKSADTAEFCQQQLEKAYNTAKNAQQKEKVTFVKELDTYLRDKGLVKGSAFCIYLPEEVTTADLTIIVKQPEKGRPHEPIFFNGTEKEMQEKVKQYPAEKYDVYLRNIETPNSPLTDGFLEQNYITITEKLIHERLHDEFNLPMKIEEALCDAAAYLFAKDFFQSYQSRPDLVKEVEEHAQAHLKKAEIITDGYETLQWLYDRNISEEKKEEFRQKYLSELGEKLDDPAINAAKLARELSYNQYFCELYLVPIVAGFSVEEMMQLYQMLPNDTEAAEKEILEWCEAVECRN